MIGLRIKLFREAQRFFQPPPHPIALDRAAGLACNGEAEAGAVCRRLDAPQRLQRERLALPAFAAGDALEFGPFPETAEGRRFRAPRLLQCFRPAHRTLCGAELKRNDAASGSSQADRRLRPRARRAASTLRPPTVAIRARNPCRRLRTSLLG